MRLKLTLLICLAILLVGGITLSRIENVSAPIRMTDDPPPKGSTEKANTLDEAAKNKTNVNEVAVKGNSKVQVQKTDEIKDNVKAGSAATSKVNK
jgi:hypothetical protein